MNAFDPLSAPALLGAILFLVSLLALRARLGPFRRRGRTPAREDLDTVVAWPPSRARVLSVHERQAYELLRRALPGYMVLAQVPLARFLRVPTRHSYSDWMHRAGSLHADLLLCDAGSRVLAVIDVRPIEETDRARRRHERMARVVKAAGIHFHVWREGGMPTPAQVRSGLGAEVAPVAHAPKPVTSRPMPLIPVPEIAEIMAASDEAWDDASTEPVPSAFFDEIEAETTAPAR